MTASRARRASRSSLPSTFVSVVLLLFVARFGLIECRGENARPPARAPSSLVESARAKPSPPEPSRAARPPLHGSLAVVSSSMHVALGTPLDDDPADEFFIDQRAFVLSYSPQKRVPNWVAWQLDRSYFGHVGRQREFRPDLTLPARFYRVKDSDYAGSGYDRGHLCPSADRQDSMQSNARTFLFTNIAPQVHELNAGPWEQFESWARRRAKRGDLLYVVAGGLFSAPFSTIGNGVAVPTANFKIIVVLKPGQGANDVDTNTEVLAVSMPNQRGVGERAWTEYSTSVDAIERASGYDF